MAKDWDKGLLFRKVRKRIMEVKISAIVLAKNEEEAIGECLESLSWVDEAILVDTGSTDKTIEIAEKHKAKVVNTESGGYSQWRNRGAKEAAGVWILYIDADERVTPLLRKEIKELISENPVTKGIYAFAIPRRNFVFKKELKHGGWYPDYVKRLFYNKEFTGWAGDLHEEPKFSGSIGHLKNALIHLKENSLEEMVEKTNKWSDIEAKLMFEANHPPMNIPRFMTAMFREFWHRMIRGLAFLDGPVGIIFALYQVYSRFISYAKLWELQQKE